jgi:hypothetical protein
MEDPSWENVPRPDFKKWWSSTSTLGVASERGAPHSWLESIEQIDRLNTWGQGQTKRNQLLRLLKRYTVNTVSFWALLYAVYVRSKSARRNPLTNFFHTVSPIIRVSFVVGESYQKQMRIPRWHLFPQIVLFRRGHFLFNWSKDADVHVKIKHLLRRTLRY